MREEEVEGRDGRGRREALAALRYAGDEPDVGQSSRGQGLREVGLRGGKAGAGARRWQLAAAL